ncbi:MAG: hypothetical protein BCS36_00035 [Desulfovibrio sp. MES5]|uniref:hypothetical protein n=1 Tax=Desulfovibrio sp. MES5 TaxID=1899016 RepID=UPI000B9D19BB|nr:hypothetical protein [Desulfovibrio sp. MES5]OXS29311.1 MAG: hypothetical protein BCS36_00035 [Desulfovibrio sp. MES5]
MIWLTQGCAVENQAAIYTRVYGGCAGLRAAVRLIRSGSERFKEALIKEPLGNAQLFRLARRDLFLKQEWTLPSSTLASSTVSKKWSNTAKRNKPALP